MLALFLHGRHFLHRRHPLACFDIEVARHSSTRQRYIYPVRIRLVAVHTILVLSCTKKRSQHWLRTIRAHGGSLSSRRGIVSVLEPPRPNPFEKSHRTLCVHFLVSNYDAIAARADPPPKRKVKSLRVFSARLWCFLEMSVSPVHSSCDRGIHIRVQKFANSMV